MSVCMLISGNGSVEPRKPFIEGTDVGCSMCCCKCPFSIPIIPVVFSVEVSMAPPSVCSDPPSGGPASKGGKVSCKSPNSRKLAKSSSGPETIGDHADADIWFMTVVCYDPPFAKFANVRSMAEETSKVQELVKKS